MLAASDRPPRYHQYALNPSLKNSAPIEADLAHLPTRRDRPDSPERALPMFDALAERFESAWKKLRGQDKISSANIQDALKDVRRALLEADVNLQVVKQFIADVETRAQGA